MELRTLVAKVKDVVVKVDMITKMALLVCKISEVEVEAKEFGQATMVSATSVASSITR